jgi:hypothetical protein
MVSDSAVTDLRASLRDRVNLPKIMPIKNCSLVAFAGEVEQGQEAFKNILKINPGSDALNALVTQNQNHPTVDFAYAYIEDATPRLFKISQGRADRVDALFLGKQSAFESFQKIRHDPAIVHAPNALHTFLSGDIPNSISEAVISMLRLFVSTGEREVGGWVLPYRLTLAGAELCTYAFSVSDPIVDKLKSGDIISHGTAEAGGFGVSVNEFREKDGFYIYWLQKLGGQLWMYSAGNYEMTEIQGAPSSFKKTVKEEFSRDVDIWFSENKNDASTFISSIQDQQGHPRLAMAKLGSNVSFSWIQNSTESFKATASISNEKDVELSPHGLFKATLSNDNKSAVIRFSESNNTARDITVDAVQLDEIIKHLGIVRASLEPQVSMEIPSGTQLPAALDPIWRARWQFHPGVQGCLLVFRHTGHGWISFLLPTHEANKLGEWLISAAKNSGFNL